MLLILILSFNEPNKDLPASFLDGLNLIVSFVVFDVLVDSKRAVICLDIRIPNVDLVALVVDTSIIIN
jgi:hypothetical protein